MYVVHPHQIVTLSTNLSGHNHTVLVQSAQQPYFYTAGIVTAATVLIWLSKVLIRPSSYLSTIL